MLYTLLILTTFVFLKCLFGAIDYKGSFFLKNTFRDLFLVSIVTRRYLALSSKNSLPSDSSLLYKEQAYCFIIVLYWKQKIKK
jgi:hypothetical protein